ncbi:hypothetical protein HY546_02140, partial [archaeon]|nr:hypothetical protein [archaeon]
MEVLSLMTRAKGLEEYEQLKRLANSDIYWDEIVEIKEVSPSTPFVYDLCVDETHNFVSELLFVHNSNVVDSLVFVLGSASIKSLRAGRLTDLVHHEAADGTAVVEVKIRNGGNTRIVSRSIDKSGQSVFRLDGRRVTKNALEEFLSSNSIHPDGHNVIMQGDVTNIVKMTPQQRREVIDEVSGIAEYESKKGDALRELAVVEDKIREADIVLVEKTSFLQVLAKEKKEAERFQELEAQKRAFKGTLLKREYSEVERQYRSGETALQKLKERAGEFETKRQESASEVENLDSQLDALMKEIMEESEKRQSGVRKEIEETKSSLAVIEEKIRAGKENFEASAVLRQKLSHEMSEIGTLVKEKENKMETLLLEAAEVKKAINSKGSEIGRLSKETAGLDKSFGEKYAQLVKLNQEVDQQKDILYKLDGDLRALQERVNLKRAALEAKGKELRSLREQEKVIRNRVGELESRKVGLEKKLKEHEQLLIKLAGEETTGSKQLGDTEVSLKETSAVLSELDSRISVMHHLSGKTKAVEAVMRNTSLKGILGTVSDVITFDPKYSAAIQAAAGQRMFHVITKTSENATHAVKFLKQEKIGKASFIPLDKIRSEKQASSLDGSLGRVSDFIRYDNSYAPALEHVFGNTFLVEDIDKAQEIGIGRARMVTLEGDLCESFGVMTGGYTKQGVTAHDLRELEELKKKVSLLEEKRASTQEMLEENRKKQREAFEAKSETELKLKEAVVLLNQWLNRIAEFEDIERNGNGEPADELSAMDRAIKNKQQDRDKLEKSLSLLIAERSKLTEVFERPEVKKLGEELRSLREEAERFASHESELKQQARSLQLEIERVLLENQKRL